MPNHSTHLYNPANGRYLPYNATLAKKKTMVPVNMVDGKPEVAKSLDVNNANLNIRETKYVFNKRTGRYFPYTKILAKSANFVGFDDLSELEGLIDSYSQIYGENYTPAVYKQKELIETVKDGSTVIEKQHVYTGEKKESQTIHEKVGIETKEEVEETTTVDLNEMNKDQLIAFAEKNFGIKLKKSQSIDTMREVVYDFHVNQQGKD